MVNMPYYLMQYDLDGKNEQIIQTNLSSCLFAQKGAYVAKIVKMNNEEPLIYWKSYDRIIVTDLNASMCNTILHKKNINDNIDFDSMTIDKTNLYILASKQLTQHIYVLKKKYASLSVIANEYVEKITTKTDVKIFSYIHALDKSLQPYPSMRCLTLTKMFIILRI